MKNLILITISIAFGLQLKAQCNGVNTEFEKLINKATCELKIPLNDTVYFLIPKEYFFKTDYNKICYYKSDGRIIGLGNPISFFGASNVSYWYKFSELSFTKKKIKAKIFKVPHTKISVDSKFVKKFKFKRG